MGMEIPFLKNKKNQGGGGPIIERVSDSSSDADLMGHVFDELMEALEKKDRTMGMEALRALVHYIQDEDAAQDMGDAS